MIKECSPMCKHMNRPLLVQHLNILQTRSLVLFFFRSKTLFISLINDDISMCNYALIAYFVVIKGCHPAVINECYFKIISV